MEIQSMVGILLIGAVLFAHSWQLLGRTDLKVPSIIALTAAIILVAGIVTSGFPRVSVIMPILVVVYATSLASVGLWGFNPRALGFYSAFAAFGILLLMVYSFVMGEVHTGVGSLILLVLFGLLAGHLIPTSQPIKMLTGWFFLVGSVLFAFGGAFIPLFSS